MPFQKVATRSELWSGEMLGLTVRSVPILLVNLNENISAFEDRCAHRGVRISEGCLRDGLLVCAAHGWEYDAHTGHGVNPQSAQLRVMPVRLEGDEILVDVGP